MKAGWEIKKLGDVIQKTETVNPLNFPEDEFNYIDVSSVSNTTFQIEETQFLIGKDAPSRARRKVKENDVLFATIRPTLRRIAIVPQYLHEQVCSTAYFVLRPKKGIDHRYIFYWLFSKKFMEQMEVLQKGASYPAVTDAEVKAQLIPLPQLSEQRRIVAILDEAFAGIAAAKEKAEQNLKNAKEVFENHLQFIFTRCSKDWKKTTLEKVLDIQPQNGWSPPSENHADCGTPVLTLSSVTGFIFKPDKIKFTSANTNLSKKYWVKNGDFLMTRSNTPELVGHVAIAHGIEKPTIYPDLIMRMIPNQEYMVNEFLYYQMRSPVLRKEITGRAQGANPTMKKISNKSAKTLPIFAPSVKIQKKIVEEVKSLSAETSLLESIYQQKLSNLEELKKSLLQQAFSGAL